MRDKGMSVTFTKGPLTIVDYHETASSWNYMNDGEMEFYLIRNEAGQILASYNPLYVLEIEEHESE